MGRQMPLFVRGAFNLVDQSQLFKQLVDDERFGTHDQVVEALNQFQTLGILTVTESDFSQPEEVEKIQAKEPSSFFGAIKKFLGVG